MMQRPKYGIVLGRFQPFHIGHYEYVARAKERCERLVIGITNPDIHLLRHSEADPKRSLASSNPFSFFLRYEAIEAALINEGWSFGSFAIVPADITDLQAVAAFLPERSESVVYATIYDAWGEEKVAKLSELGFFVEVLWRRDMSQRATSGTEVRKKMALGEPWEHLVPPGAYRVLSGYLAKEIALDA